MGDSIAIIAVFFLIWMISMIILVVLISLVYYIAEKLYEGDQKEIEEFRDKHR